MEALTNRILQAGKAWLFLDYDGTLTGFAPTPEDIQPEPALIDLLGKLSHCPQLRLAVISGRSLSILTKLLPLKGIYLAGTYGLELQTPDGKRLYQSDYDSLRPYLNLVKPCWEKLITGREGFYLEDKGWTLALHARFAEEAEAEQVLSAARDCLPAQGLEQYRLLGGHRFFEIAPVSAQKSQCVEYLLKNFPFPGALLVYIGDDDKDVEAFQVIHAAGGMALLVQQEGSPPDAAADRLLSSPAQLRAWLVQLSELLK